VHFRDKGAGSAIAERMGDLHAQCGLQEIVMLGVHVKVLGAGTRFAVAAEIQVAVLAQ